MRGGGGACSGGAALEAPHDGAGGRRDAGGLSEDQDEAVGRRPSLAAAKLKVQVRPSHMAPLPSVPFRCVAGLVGEHGCVGV